MIKADAIAFLNGIVPTSVNMITVDAVKWADFKTSVLAILNDPTLDPKWAAAIKAINVIDDALKPLP